MKPYRSEPYWREPLYLFLALPLWMLAVCVAAVLLFILIMVGIVLAAWVMSLF